MTRALSVLVGTRHVTGVPAGCGWRAAQASGPRLCSPKADSCASRDNLGSHDLTWPSFISLPAHTRAHTHACASHSLRERTHSRALARVPTAGNSFLGAWLPTALNPLPSRGSSSEPVAEGCRLHVLPTLLPEPFLTGWPPRLEAPSVTLCHHPSTDRVARAIQPLMPLCSTCPRVRTPMSLTPKSPRLPACIYIWLPGGDLLVESHGPPAREGLVASAGCPWLCPCLGRSPDSGLWVGSSFSHTDVEVGPVPAQDWRPTGQGLDPSSPAQSMPLANAL